MGARELPLAERHKLSDVAAQYVRKGAPVQVTTEWLRPSAWIDQSGQAQATIDLDANRLVLLDRAGNGAAQSDENSPQ